MHPRSLACTAVRMVIHSAPRWAVGLAALLTLGTGLAAAGTLQTVRERGTLQCGINPALAGFGRPNASGVYEGLNADLCRALAAAIFDDPAKVRFVPLTAASRVPALLTGEIDVLAHNTTWTLSRDIQFGFPAALFYDGQGFMVHRRLGVASAKDLAGASICIQQGSTSELNLADYFRAAGVKYEPLAFATNDEALNAYTAGRCDALTTDLTSLAAERVKLPDPEAEVILPDVISKEPLGPAVRHGDDQWFNLVRWTVFALVNAEELGVTRANVSAMAASANPELRRFLGTDGRLGEGLGLTPDWAARIVRAVGNYGEIYARNLGEGSPMKIARGQNRLWTQGGLLYGAPVR